MEDPKGEFLKIELQECSFYKDKIILKFLGYDSFAEISGFIGNKLYIKRKALPPLKDDEFYWTDLFGMKVITLNNEYLGEVIDFLETGSNDVLVISKESDEILLPAIKEVIKKIDYNNNSILVELFEGLI